MEYPTSLGTSDADGEHVEIVDLLAARFQVSERPRHSSAKADQIGIGHGG